MTARVVHGHDDGVGDDVLDDLRGLADLRDDAGEGLAREGVHRERHAVLQPDPADVGLVHADLDLHLREVLGDREEDRRLQARRHRLPDVHRSRDDHAVDRRADRGVLEIHLGLDESRLLLVHLGARRQQHRIGHAELGGGRLDRGARATVPWPGPRRPGPPRSRRRPGRCRGRYWRSAPGGTAGSCGRGRAWRRRRPPGPWPCWPCPRPARPWRSRRRPWPSGPALPG